MSTPVSPVCLKSTSFIPHTTFQFVWDSTSLGLLKTCPRKYYYTMIQGWRSKAEALPLTYGILYHEAFQWFDQAKAKGMDTESALRFTIRLIHAKTYKWDSGDTTRSRETLMRSIVWYVEQFYDDPCETIILANGEAAVELSFKLPIGIQGFGHEIFFSGHLDRVVKFQDKVFISDKKTTTSGLSDFYFDRYNPDNQISLYTFAGKIIYDQHICGTIIDAVQIGVTFSRYARKIINRTDSQLNEWFADAKTYIEQAEACSHKPNSFLVEAWPMNDTACDKYGGCPFKGVCSRSPEVRSSYLASDFQQVLWDPSKPRDHALPSDPRTELPTPAETPC